MILVLDSSALITLARIGGLDLLRQLAGGVRIPEAVYEEVVQAGQVRHDVVQLPIFAFEKRACVRRSLHVY